MLLLLLICVTAMCLSSSHILSLTVLQRLNEICRHTLYTAIVQIFYYFWLPQNLLKTRLPTLQVLRKPPTRRKVLYYSTARAGRPAGRSGPGANFDKRKRAGLKVQRAGPGRIDGIRTCRLSRYREMLLAILYTALTFLNNQSELLSNAVSYRLIFSFSDSSTFCYFCRLTGSTNSGSIHNHKIL